MAAILSAVVLPAFSAIAVENVDSSKLENNSSKADKSAADERRLKEQELRKKASIKLLDIEQRVDSLK